MTELYLDGNPLTNTSLSALSGLTKLKKFHAPLDGVPSPTTDTSLSFLTNLTALTELNFRRWKVRDISVLANLTALKTLYLEYNRIGNISALGSLTKLETLDLSTNLISSISPLGSATKLNNLGLSFNNFTDISALGSLTALTVLKIDKNRGLSDISALSNLTKLTELYLDATSITAAGLRAVLPSLTLLKKLDISGTPVSDLSVLGSFTGQLTNLAVSHMQNPGGTSHFNGRLLKDLTPLVALMQSGKLTKALDVRNNWNLDYASIYTDIPALIAGNIKVQYSPGTGVRLQRKSDQHHRGFSGSEWPFEVSAETTFNVPIVNESLAEVPIKWKVTASDGTVTEETVKTGANGRSNWTLTLGDAGETYTVEAIVPAKTNPSPGPSHPERKVAFTVNAYSKPVITLTLDSEAVTKTQLKWNANVSTTLPADMSITYAIFYKKSAYGGWFKDGHYVQTARSFSHVHSSLEPGTSYDFQVFALDARSTWQQCAESKHPIAKSSTCFQECLGGVCCGEHNSGSHNRRRRLGCRGCDDRLCDYGWRR